MTATPASAARLNKEIVVPVPLFAPGDRVDVGTYRGTIAGLLRVEDGVPYYDVAFGKADGNVPAGKAQVGYAEHALKPSSDKRARKARQY